MRYAYRALPGGSFTTTAVVTPGSADDSLLLGYRDLINHFVFYTPDPPDEVVFLLRDPGIDRPGRTEEPTPGS